MEGLLQSQDQRRLDQTQDGRLGSLNHHSQHVNRVPFTQTFLSHPQSRIIQKLSRGAPETEPYLPGAAPRAAPAAAGAQDPARWSVMMPPRCSHLDPSPPPRLPFPSPGILSNG